MLHNTDIVGIVWFSRYMFGELGVLPKWSNTDSRSRIVFYNNRKRKGIMILKDEDIEFIRFSKDCLNKGRYPHTEQLTEVYNRCFADRPNFRPIHNTNCGSCIKHRICELYGEMEVVLSKLTC